MSMLLGKIKYAFDEVSEHYQDTYWWRQRLEHRLVGPLQSHIRNHEGVDVMKEDWDNLLVIDACRTDLFEETVDIEQFDDYWVVESKGSATPEWMEENFAGREFGDTVYVSGNPWVSKKAPNSFHEIINVWIDEYDLAREDLKDAEGLDELGLTFGATIAASRVNKSALEAAKKYPNKRIIVHYFQPHAPYVGKSNGELKDFEEIREIHPGKPLKEGKFTREEVWSEYKENMQYVMHHVRDLMEELNGKTVVTSDHGEMFGERLFPIPIRGYAHPIGLRSPELIEVPWAIDGGNRRRITSEGTSKTSVEDKDIDERLQDLGYRT